jgi:hypothetical protein
MIQTLPVLNHGNIKQKFLDCLDAYVHTYRIGTTTKSITYSDFYSDKDRPYIPLLEKYIYPIVRQHYCDYGAIVSDFKPWFHQYFNGDSFNWHNHTSDRMAGLYYIELPETTGTKFYNTGYVATEGTLALFPGWLLHQSPSNDTNKRKTIISFNFKVNTDVVKMNELRTNARVVEW